ncbi:putative membrane protein YczE [Murinocardiopsis flavida]|uniref:Putative membrane protein YczE n=1 Tax=Murinocardiopsis flavida TaxID=645275 RepID=A0A2P8DSK6_9ACTN|nr:hypothetical protein [Murinocardiopsis flavida]PSL00209.1 putative membrane protein YczE [Murinocardiopsis flavida]
MSAPSALVRRVFLTPALPGPRWRRLVQLAVGLYLFGLGCALPMVSGLGANPWDVLHQGLAQQTGLTVGTWTIIMGGTVMLLWIPLRQRAGIGTFSNVVVVGLSVDVSLWWLPEVEGLPARIAALLLGILVLAIGTGCYIGARLGPGPRDGLMTGLAAKGWSVRAARTTVEVSVVVLGFLLGGTVGVGTLLFAVAIGPLAQVFLPLLDVPVPDAGPPPAGGAT